MHLIFEWCTHKTIKQTIEIKSTPADGSANSEISIPEIVNNEFETSIPDELPETDIAVTLEAKTKAEMKSTVKNQRGCGIPSVQRKAQKSTKLWKMKGPLKNF